MLHFFNLCRYYWLLLVCYPLLLLLCCAVCVIFFPFFLLSLHCLINANIPVDTGRDIQHTWKWGISSTKFRNFYFHAHSASRSCEHLWCFFSIFFHSSFSSSYFSILHHFHSLFSIIINFVAVLVVTRKQWRCKKCALTHIFFPDCFWEQRLQFNVE